MEEDQWEELRELPKQMEALMGMALSKTTVS